MCYLSSLPFYGSRQPTATSPASVSSTKGGALASKFGKARVCAKQSVCFSSINASSGSLPHLKSFLSTLWLVYATG